MPERPEAPGADGPPADPADERTWDRLAGDWRIWQYRRGHRWSTDDLVVAWLAARLAPDAEEVLDLGAGIGSVGLLTLWRLPRARLTMVEAQRASQRLARDTVRDNGIEGRVSFVLGDLREVALDPRWPLVTGSPPYFPLGTGSVSPVAQRAAARMELRGSVLDYAHAAARALAPGGWFVYCLPAADPRGRDAPGLAGLHLRHRQVVWFRADQPLLGLYAATREPGPLVEAPPLHVRGADGAWTDDYLAMRLEMGTHLDRRTPLSPRASP